MHTTRIGTPLSPDQVRKVESALRMERGFLELPPRGLRLPREAPLAAGWACSNCGKAHAPHVQTCPEPANDASLGSA